MTWLGNDDEQSKLKVFVSYSRKDTEFAQELVAGLRATGFEPYLDKDDITPGEDWELRLGRLIETCDTMIFVISPNAVGSERCDWEMKRAMELRRRLLPIVWRHVEAKHVPEPLAQLNYIYFDRAHAFGPSLLLLATALRTDIDWVREHTRISEAALRWSAHARADALLWRGEELTAAKATLKSQPKYAPVPAVLTLEFINASDGAEAALAGIERQRLEQIAAAQADKERSLKSEKDAIDKAEAALQQTQAAIRNRQRAQAAIGMLLVGIIIGLVAWINQSYLLEQYDWYTRVRPYMTAHFRPRVLTADAERRLQPGAAFRECSESAACPEMVVVPSGKFLMGSANGELGRGGDEGPQTSIEIGYGFAVSKFPVTFDEWDACTSFGGCVESLDSDFGRGKRPVINVTWGDAKQYVAWLSKMTGKDYRLLSEAEWEYAARAGTTSPYSWGDQAGRGNANCRGCGSQFDGKGPSPVGSFKPNAFGLYDVHGNVWQWVQDCYVPSFADLPTTGAARETTEKCRRVARGGSWIVGPLGVRSAARSWGTFAYRDFDRGLRVARPLAGQKQQ